MLVQSDMAATSSYQVYLLVRAMRTDCEERPWLHW